MRGGPSALIACAALALAAGCGSSKSSTATTSATAPAATPTTSTPTAPTPTTPTGGLKATGTIKYATPPPSAPVLSGVVPIAYRDITIAPDAIKVKVGSTIRWTNYDSIEHTVTSQSGPEHFESGTFGEGRSFRIIVTKPGVIHYECRIHPASMNGTIEVVP